MMDEKDWAEFKRKLKSKTEIDLDLYKEPQMKRRIGNLVTRASMNSYVEYFDNAAKNKDDFAAFIEYLTINVSEFFRTPEKFGKLETDVIPDLLKRSSKLNIWSAGCSIGAEPYSLAIIMKEMTPNVKHRILASDLDIEILAKAKRGVYTKDEIKAMKPDRLNKYFKPVEGEKYAVNQEIKNCIEFKRHNLLKDPFENGFDLILCRNVVIYFTEEAKDQLYANFFKALKPGGILFVGATEAILNFRKLGYTSFQPFFYQKPLT
ncbi:CheR family methyltransferase [Selenomonas ruminantium]|uniref:Chemotaxis protein methyltransferase CheR n=1 Tax=Selenomonas ruminantium TaxID=971 RepID=A0A1I0W8C9_SELRU|nr:protein-glutamate O-methyltransferase CheR [Selenomonas ruminantium]SDZ84464.1 chemotaxis protein methyltransferase CheR [Selenomonas ruminantium]SFA84999.1 chemotaxis protein methyltransferase CheR [Selenomonas ruminantium]